MLSYLSCLNYTLTVIVQDTSLCPVMEYHKILHLHSYQNEENLYIYDYITQLHFTYHTTKLLV